jgi:hypothetical protein
MWSFRESSVVNRLIRDMIKNGNINTSSNTIRIDLDNGIWDNRILDMEASKRALITRRTMENLSVPTIRFETEEMRWDRIIKEKLNGVSPKP